MAYPPPIPTADRTNVTPQVDTHPADHNAIHNALTDIVNELGTDPSLGRSSVTALLAELVPVGMITPFAGATAPGGWALCRGQPVAKATYPQLWALIGTTYGPADATNFTLPSLAGRSPMGHWAGGSWATTLGAFVGSADTTMIEHQHQMPAHTHPASTSGTDGAHPHTQTGFDFGANVGYLYRRGDFGGWEALNGSGTGTASYSTPDVAPNGSGHGHAITVDLNPVVNTVLNTVATGTATNANLSPVTVVNFIIRLG